MLAFECLPKSNRYLNAYQVALGPGEHSKWKRLNHLNVCELVTSGLKLDGQPVAVAFGQYWILSSCFRCC